MVILGVDLGGKGAIAVVDSNDGKLIDWLSFYNRIDSYDCDVNLINQGYITDFLKRYHSQIEAVCVEVPAKTAFTGNSKYVTQAHILVKLGYYVGQFKTICDFLGLTTKFVDALQWKKHHSLFKLSTDEVIERFQGVEPHSGCKFKYQFEGVADAYFIALWYMNKKCLPVAS